MMGDKLWARQAADKRAGCRVVPGTTVP